MIDTSLCFFPEIFGRYKNYVTVSLYIDRILMTLKAISLSISSVIYNVKPFVKLGGVWIHFIWHTNLDVREIFLGYNKFTFKKKNMRRSWYVTIFLLGHLKLIKESIKINEHFEWSLKSWTKCNTFLSFSWNLKVKVILSRTLVPPLVLVNNNPKKMIYTFHQLPKVLKFPFAIQASWKGKMDVYIHTVV